MSLYRSTTKFIKIGQSRNPFLLFVGSRKSQERSLDGPLSSIFTGLLFVLVAAALAVCIYAFITGKLG
jgi:hypothetical protein